MIDILGTKYDYDLTTEREDIGLCDCDGYCDACGKRISIQAEHNEVDPHNTKNLSAYVKKIKRHEIVHAFLFESGLAARYAEDETIVEWIAWQFPKLLTAFQQAECLD